MVGRSDGMGVYFNPNNESFTRAKNSQIFVDKTGLMEKLNRRLSTEENCIEVYEQIQCDPS